MQFLLKLLKNKFEMNLIFLVIVQFAEILRMQ